MQTLVKEFKLIIWMYLVLTDREKKSAPEESRVDRLRSTCQGVDRSRLLPVVCQRGDDDICIETFSQKLSRSLLLWGPQGEKTNKQTSVYLSHLIIYFTV